MASLPDPAIWCHRTGFKKTCHEMVTKRRCQLWLHIIGEHPQTGAMLDQWGCADALMPLLTIQNGRLIGETTASVDKVATEVKTHRDESVALGAIGVQRLRDAAKEAIDSRLGAPNALPRLFSSLPPEDDDAD